MQTQVNSNRTNDDTVTDAVRWRILIVLLAAIAMSLVNVSIVNVALPAIQKGLGASQSDLQWVLSGYALTFGVVLVAAGLAGDIMGRGGILIIGVAVFTLASVASIVAQRHFTQLGTVCSRGCTMPRTGTRLLPQQLRISSLLADHSGRQG